MTLQAANGVALRFARLVSAVKAAEDAATAVGIDKELLLKGLVKDSPEAELYYDACEKAWGHVVAAIKNPGLLR